MEKDLLKTFKARLIKKNKLGTLFFNSFLNKQNSIDLSALDSILNLDSHILEMFKSKKMRIDFSALNISNIEQEAQILNEEILNTSIEDLQFGSRIDNLLLANNIDTVNDLIDKGTLFWSNIKGLTKKHENQITNKIHQINQILNSEDKISAAKNAKETKAKAILKRVNELKKKDLLQIEQKNVKGLGIGYPFVTGYTQNKEDGLEFFRAPILIWNIELDIKQSICNINVGDPILNNSLLSILANNNGVIFEFQEIENNNEIYKMETMTKIMSSVNEPVEKNWNHEYITDAKLISPKQISSKDKKKMLQKVTTKIENILSLGMYDVASSSILGAYELIEKKGDLDFIDKIIQKTNDFLLAKDEKNVFDDTIFISNLDQTQKNAVDKSIKESTYIWGPPGTGKSETITNILANLIYQEKKTIFITEKRVASDVVYERLGILNDFAIKLYGKNSNQEFHEKVKYLTDEIRTYLTKGEQLFLSKHNIKIDHNNIAKFRARHLKNFNEYKQFKNIISLEKHNKYIDYIQKYKNDSITSSILEKIELNELDQLTDFLNTFCKSETDFLEIKRLAGLKLHLVSQLNNTDYWNHKRIVAIIRKVNGSIKSELAKSIALFIEDFDLNNLEEYVYMHKIYQKILGLFDSFANLAQFWLDYSNYDFDLINNFYTLVKVNGEIFKKASDSIATLTKTLSLIQVDNLINEIYSFSEKEIMKKIYNLINNKKDSKSIPFFKLNKFKSWTRSGYGTQIITAIRNIILNVDETIKMLEIYKSEKEVSFLKIMNENFWITKLEFILQFWNYSDQLKIQLSLYNDLVQNTGEFFIKNFDKNQLKNDLNLFMEFIAKDYDDNLIDDLLVIKKMGKIFENKKILSLFDQHLNYSTIEYLNMMNYENLISQELNVDLMFQENILKPLEDEIEMNKFIIYLKRMRDIKQKINQSKIVNGKLFILKDELNKMIKLIESRKNFVKIKTYFQHFEQVIKILFPIIISSPEEISNPVLLPLNREEFDFAIFDEASQIFTEKAIPVMYRSKMQIVSGDDKQLPPTDFFNVKSDEGDILLTEDIDDLEDQIKADVMENVSLLEFSKSRFMNNMLQYHYRSKYKELIEFSNHSFYESNLVVVDRPKREWNGIEVIEVDGIWENQTNNHEALKIVEKVLEIINNVNHPLHNKTIGIITFNARQQNLIETYLDQAAINNKILSQRLNPEITNEHIFVKNIENVQGDERDVIFFSIAFSFDINGRFINNFGPIGKRDGQKRLNVAVSRAKEKMIIVKSIQSNVINAQSESAKHFKTFLKYCEIISQNGFDAINTIFEKKNQNKDELDSYKIDILQRDVINELSRALPEYMEIVANIDVNNNFVIPIGIKLKDSNEYLLGINLEINEGLILENEIYNKLENYKFLKARGWKICNIFLNDWFSLLNPKSKEENIDRILGKYIKTDQEKLPIFIN